MPKHPHAELMALYAQDAMETDAPWEMWQFFGHGGWLNCNSTPIWCEDVEYRRKPRTITINGYEVPEPVREALNDGEWYCVPSLDPAAFSIGREWTGSVCDLRLLSDGLIHLDSKSARIHQEALLAPTRKFIDCEQDASPPPSGTS